MKSLYSRANINDVNNLERLNDTINNKFMANVIKEYVKTRNNSYFTIYNLRDSYYKRIKKAKQDAAKIEKINKEYIEHFKNIEKLVVLKENKDGTLIFKDV